MRAVLLNSPKRAVPAGLVVLAFALLAHPAAAHVLDVDLSKLSRSEIFWTYLRLGFTHIIPLGFDHILFIISLYLLEPRLKPVLLQATAFTVAHSITLGLAMYGFIRPPAAIIEPVIALSILFVAIENIITDRLNPWRVAIVFGFGLVHGMGFASALTGLGLPAKDYFGSLISFNVGVELGQVSVILLAWAVVGRWAADKSWYKRRVVVPVSVAIGLVAAYWTVERVFFT
ncbi:HupE/UreJ family protein [Hymenobacter sp. BT770]|uniref:HupE/UreJ family protein n=1 Tax=Hymenobacter sp. BT770 TaxID=2886942 RepID=UPI001D0F8E10|nr:HupE/UreJ family protein [Hymenobacter sp. BT770]MCC3154864.1 HupE/UreJ family protein [Hymenobacter sp. BT770]MDO3415612.1 HupE/UreJ family protein [Hymenobacter sp. BT770]